MNNAEKTADLTITKPAQVPHEKNGEQPAHSFSGEAALVVSSFLLEDCFWQRSLVQHGLAERSTTNNDNIKQITFTL